MLQTGGSDQWGNLTSGVDLVKRAEGATVHAIGTPLITNSDGRKFGKSEGNAVWLDDALTSPYAFYQFWLNTDDADVVKLLKVFTFIRREAIESLAEDHATAPHLREAQKTLAFEVTSLVHGVDATKRVLAASEALFGQGDLGSLDEATLAAAVAALPHVETEPGALIAQLLVDTGLTKSLGESRRAIAQGGVYVNNRKVDDASAVASEALAGWITPSSVGARKRWGAYFSVDHVMSSSPRAASMFAAHERNSGERRRTGCDGGFATLRFRIGDIRSDHGKSSTIAFSGGARGGEHPRAVCGRRESSRRRNSSLP